MDLHGKLQHVSLTAPWTLTDPQFDPGKVCSEPGLLVRSAVGLYRSSCSASLSCACSKQCSGQKMASVTVWALFK